MAQFEVQTVDRDSGIESWTLVSAPTADAARTRVMDAGMMVGAVKLKAMDDPPPAPTPFTSAGYGAACPMCGTQLIPRGRGLHGTAEILFCVLFLLFWLIPGVIYYVWIDSKPYCPKCNRRV